MSRNSVMNICIGSHGTEGKKINDGKSILFYSKRKKFNFGFICIVIIKFVV